MRGLLVLVMSASVAPAMADTPLDLRAPIEFNYAGSLELAAPEATAAPLKLDAPAMPGADAGLPGLLGRVAPALGLPAVGKDEAPQPTPLTPPVATPLAVPAPMHLTTKLGQAGKALGEFRTRDWNAIGGVAPLAGPDSAPPAAMVLPAVDVMKLSEAQAAPAGAQLKAPEETPGDTGPASMAEAEAALADAQARTKRGRGGREPLMVLPDFGTSSFQVGVSHSLAGFERGLSGRQGFGLASPGAGESLRLGNPDDPAPATKPAKDGQDKRLWTGVSFNF